MAQRYEHAPMSDAQLVDNVGIIADRLVATCRSNTENADSDMRELLEQALIVAVEQQQLSAQSKRLVALELLLNAAVVLFGAAEIPVHASLGVATFGAGDEAADVVTRADAAMYRKKQGKPPVPRAWRIRRD